MVFDSSTLCVPRAYTCTSLTIARASFAAPAVHTDSQFDEGSYPAASMLPCDFHTASTRAAATLLSPTQSTSLGPHPTEGYVLGAFRGSKSIHVTSAFAQLLPSIGRTGSGPTKRGTMRCSASNANYARSFVGTTRKLLRLLLPSFSLSCAYVTRGWERQLQFASNSGSTCFIYRMVAVTVVVIVTGTMPGVRVMLDDKFYFGVMGTYLAIYVSFVSD